LRLARGASYPASHHLVSIVLTDQARGAPVGLDYRADTAIVTDARGNIAQVRLAIPAGTTLPTSVKAYVVADVFPLAAIAF
jgi:hypothetical protein